MLEITSNAETGRPQPRDRSIRQRVAVAVGGLIRLRFRRPGPRRAGERHEAGQQHRSRSQPWHAQSPLAPERPWIAWRGECLRIWGNARRAGSADGRIWVFARELALSLPRFPSGILEASNRMPRLFQEP